MMSKPALLFVHGAGGGGWEWRIWLRVFEAAGWEIAAPDLIPTAAGTSGTQFDDYVAQVSAWIDDLAGPPPLVIGASLGGLLALKAAGTQPVSGLVLVNALPPAQIPGWPPGRVSFPAVIDWSARTAQDSLRELPDSDAGFCEEFTEAWRLESGAAMAAAYAGVTVAVPTFPCLVVVGDADQEVPHTYGVAMAKLFQADLCCFSQVSHLGALMGRRAPLIATMVLEWIECMYGGAENGDE
jgi:pimeloyl-ACP methyl ester carboxylesterase